MKRLAILIMLAGCGGAPAGDPDDTSGTTTDAGSGGGSSGGAPDLGGNDCTPIPDQGQDPKPMRACEWMDPGVCSFPGEDLGTIDPQDIQQLKDECPPCPYKNQIACTEQGSCGCVTAARPGNPDTILTCERGSVAQIMDSGDVACDPTIWPAPSGYDAIVAPWWWVEPAWVHPCETDADCSPNIECRGGDMQGRWVGFGSCCPPKSSETDCRGGF